MDGLVQDSQPSERRMGAEESCHPGKEDLRESYRYIKSVEMRAIRKIMRYEVPNKTPALGMMQV